MTDTPRFSFKRGDSFRLDLTVTDPSNATALAAAVTLAAAQAALVVTQAAIPYVAQDEIDAQVVVDAAQVAYDAAIVVDITGWTITSKMAWCGKLIQSFEITITDALLGTLNIQATEFETILWNTREHELDVLFVRADGSTSCETIYVDVERGATNG